MVKKEALKLSASFLTLNFALFTLYFFFCSFVYLLQQICYDKVAASYKDKVVSNSIGKGCMKGIGDSRETRGVKPITAGHIIKHLAGKGAGDRGLSQIIDTFCWHSV